MPSFRPKGVGSWRSFDMLLRLCHAIAPPPRSSTHTAKSMSNSLRAFGASTFYQKLSSVADALAITHFVLLGAAEFRGNPTKTLIAADPVYLR